MNVALSCTKPSFSCFPLALEYKQIILLLVKTELIQQEQIWCSFTALLRVLSPGQWRHWRAVWSAGDQTYLVHIWGLLHTGFALIGEVELDLPWTCVPFKFRVLSGIGCASQSFCMCFGLLIFTWKSSTSRLGPSDAWTRPPVQATRQHVCNTIYLWGVQIFCAMSNAFKFHLLRTFRYHVWGNLGNLACNQTELLPANRFESDLEVHTNAIPLPGQPEPPQHVWAAREKGGEGSKVWGKLPTVMWFGTWGKKRSLPHHGDSRWWGLRRLWWYER